MSGKRIEDWQDPWLPAPVRLANRALAPWAVRAFPLDVDGLIESAKRRTGLDDLGDPDFREALTRIVEEVEADPGLRPIGRGVTRSILGQLLRARLCVEHALKEMPDPDVPSEASPDGDSPVVIVGLPRTGTTHLHNLLSRSHTLRSLPLWESIEPFRAPRARGPDLRRLTTWLRLRQIDRLLPLFSSMHEMEVDLPHEELQLSALTFRSFFFESTFRIPDYQRWYVSQDHTDAYRYLGRVLRALCLAREGQARRWVLKSPQHVDQLSALDHAFPRARIVRTHRDPVEVVASFATMMIYTRRVIYTDIDVQAEARGWADRLEQMLRASIRQGDALAPERLLDIRFPDFMRDPAATVERVFAFTEQAFSAADREAVQAHLARHTRDRHGRIDYDLAGLGLDAQQLREQFRFYTDRFDIT